MGPGSFLYWTLACVLSPSLALAQGVAALAPMSKTVGPGEEQIAFLVQNLTTDEIRMSYVPECDIDGKEAKGADCLSAFEVSLSPAALEGILTIPQGGRIEGRVRLKKLALGFALFKPIFEPIRDPGAKKAKGVSFEFGYQPGYLFIVSPKPQTLPPPTFSTAVQGTTRRVKFAYGISNFTMPALLNVSAKITRKSDKKLIRFLSLAREKIADPKRATLEMESDFALATNSEPVCFQIFVDDKFAKKTTTSEGCEP